MFNNIEVLDFCGPYEVFSVTRLDESKRREESSPFEVVLVAETNNVITAQGRLRVLPDFTIENVLRLMSTSFQAVGKYGKKSIILHLLSG